MKNQRLPERINPLRMAQSRVELSGSLCLGNMPRLSSLVSRDIQEQPKEQIEQHIQVTLKFDIDEQRRVVIAGKVATTLPLECQRCLQPFDLKAESEFLLVPVQNLEDAKALPSMYEPLMMLSIESAEKHLAETFSLQQMVEDELLLVLPVIPKHDIEACGVNLQNYSEEERVTTDRFVTTDRDESIETNGFQRENPFAKLSILKEKLSKNE